MVCFDITLAYSQNISYKGLLLQEKRIEHLRKLHNADILGRTLEDGIVYVRFGLCDKDVVGLLRDIPHPVYCVKIKSMRTDTLVYSFCKVTRKKVLPPRESAVLKDIYWSASQLERRRLFV